MPNRSEIIDRLADACEEQGRAEEAKEFRRQAKRSAAAMETWLNVSSAGTRTLILKVGNALLQQ